MSPSLSVMLPHIRNHKPSLEMSVQPPSRNWAESASWWVRHTRLYLKHNKIQLAFLLPGNIPVCTYYVDKVGLKLIAILLPKLPGADMIGMSHQVTRPSFSVYPRQCPTPKYQGNSRHQSVVFERTLFPRQHGPDSQIDLHGGLSNGPDLFLGLSVANNARSVFFSP